MKALKLIAAAALLGWGVSAAAQDVAKPADKVHVYMVGKVDAQHVVITEVMEVPTTLKREELLARVRAAHPTVTIPESTEGIPSSSAAAAEKSRADMKARLEKQGKTVTMLEAR